MGTLFTRTRQGTRLAREIRPIDSDSTCPLEFTNNVVDTIGIACFKPIGVSLYGLNLYTTGGFFHFHQDIRIAANRVGTFVIALPIDFEGGEFISVDTRSQIGQFNAGYAIGSGHRGEMGRWVEMNERFGEELMVTLVKKWRRN